MTNARSSLLLFVALVVACGAVRKPPTPSRRLAITTKGSFFSGSNGYLFGVLPDASSKVVRLDVRYPVGSAQDPEGKEGLAHLVEHLLFEVEVDHPKGRTSISARLAEISLYYNAETADDYTHYEVQAHPSALPELMWLEAARLRIGCAGLTPEVFERERQIVLNELRQRRGSDDGNLLRALRAEVYGQGHPYRKVASLASVSALEFSDVCQFIEQQYVRGVATVVASGAVTDEATKRAATASMAALPARRVDDVPSPASEYIPAHKSKLRLAVDRPMLLMTWPLPVSGTQDRLVLETLTSTLAGRIDAFALTYGWGESSSAFVSGGDRAPFLVVSVVLDSVGDVGEAKDAVGKAVEYTLRTVERSWRLYLEAGATRLISRYERLPGRARLVSDFLQSRRKGALLLDELASLNKTSGKRARAIAAHWLKPSKASVLVVEPAESAASGAVAGSAFDPIHSSPYGARVDVSEADTPIPIPDDTGLVLSPLRYVTDNGLTVVLWPHGEMPLAHGRLVVSSGASHDPDGTPGVAMLSGFDDVYEDSMVYRYTGLATRIDEVVGLVALELRSPGRTISDETKERILGRVRDRKAARQREHWVKMFQALYGPKHPYARPIATEQSIKRIGHDVLQGWARRHIVPKNATLIVAGKFDVDLVRKHIEYNTDQVDGGSDSPAVEILPHGQLPQFIPAQGEPDQPTVDIEVRFAGNRGIGHDYAHRRVITAILNSKLAALRDELAVSYGFSASYAPRSSGGLWEIRGRADAARAKQAGAAVQALLLQLQKGPDQYRAEFVAARREVVDSLLASAADSQAVANRLELIARFNLDPGFYDKLVRRVAALRLDEVHGVITRELNRDRQVFGAFGPGDAGSEAVVGARTAVADGVARAVPEE